MLELFFLTGQYFYLFIYWYQRLNSKPCIYQASAWATELNPQLLIYSFLRWVPGIELPTLRLPKCGVMELHPQPLGNTFSLDQPQVTCIMLSGMQVGHQFILLFIDTCYKLLDVLELILLNMNPVTLNSTWYSRTDTRSRIRLPQVTDFKYHFFEFIYIV